MESYTDHDIAQLFPEACAIAESYGLTAGLLIGGGFGDPVLQFYCDFHPGWGPVLEFTAAPEGYADMWALFTALDTVPEDFGFRGPITGDMPTEYGLDGIKFMGDVIEQAGYARVLTVPLMLLYQQRRHLWYMNHVVPDEQHAQQHLRDAAQILMLPGLTPAEKRDFMQRHVTVPQITALLTQGVPYMLAAETFPRGDADIYS